MSSVQQKTTRHTKKQESMTIQRKKKKSTETGHEKDLLVDILDKDFKTTIKEGQRTKGKYGESQENDV